MKNKWEVTLTLCDGNEDIEIDYENYSVFQAEDGLMRVDELENTDRYIHVYEVLREFRTELNLLTDTLHTEGVDFCAGMGNNCDDCQANKVQTRLQTLIKYVLHYGMGNTKKIARDRAKIATECLKLMVQVPKI